MKTEHNINERIKIAEETMETLNEVLKKEMKEGSDSGVKAAKISIEIWKLRYRIETLLWVLE